MKQKLPGYLPRWSRPMLLALLVGSASAASAQKGPDAPYFQSDATARQATAGSPLAQQLRQYQAYTLDLAGLRQRLAGARLRGVGAALTLSLPQPDGTTQRFAVWEAPLLAPALAAQHPTVHTYGGQGIDDPTAQLSLTVSATGLLAQILTQQPGGSVYLEAASKDDTRHILSYYAQDVLPAVGNPGACGTLPTVPQPPPAPQGRGPNTTGKTNAITQPIGPTLTVYRLIVTTTKEYGASVHSAANGTDSTDVLTNVTALVNNVRTIQERDLAVTMSLVNYRFYNTTLTGNYDQTSDMQMIQQNRINVENRYGSGAFDLAHLFAASSSGLAYVGVIANPTLASPYSATTVPTTGPSLTYKAGAVSGNGGRSSPVAYFSTSVIAHEMGHQFGGTHTFNGGCAPNRSATSAWEPGSGSTIMSYADVGCGATIESRADSYYHAGSIDQIRTYVEAITASYSAGTTFSSGNTPPTVTVPANKTIPQGTPFKLVATATDANAADVLNYNWEELDTGSLADVTATQVANDNFPLFRSILPSTGGATRYFPRLSYLGGSPTASTNGTERLPTVARALNFKCTVRDNHTGTGTAYSATASGIVGGVTESSLVTLTVSAANSTPFAVTAPNTGVKWVAGSTQTVTWNGVGTKSSAVNCQTVNIRLSTDGGATYPTVLLSGVPNVDGTGTASIAVPASLNTTTARIMVEAADNYFFDISDTNFTITTGPVALSLSPASGPVGTVVTILGDNFGTAAADLGVTFTGLTGTVAGTIGTVTNGSIQVTVPAAALTGPVVVTRTGVAAGTSSPGSFSVTPVLSGTNPTAGAEGSAVTLSGTGLGNALRVSFNGVVVQSPNFVSTGYTAQPNTLTVNVPFGATTGPVTVTTVGGISNALPFTVTSFTFSPLALNPPSGAGAASEAANVVATLNGPPDASAATTAPLKVSSLQAGGRRAGTTTVSGNTIVFDPTTNFRAGEVVQVTLTTAATTGTSTALARPYVGQYTTRTRPANGLGTSVDYTAGVGTRPESIVAGNLNADAALDLVMVNRTSSTVSVMLNNGTGTGFVAAAGSPIAVGTTPLHALLADLNNDGNLDLLVTCSGGTINVLQGNGDGTFTAQTSITGLGAAAMTAVGDLNGDGNLDLVTAVSTSTLARAVIGLANTDATGNGNFTFATSQYNGLDAGPQAVVLADFNEDGRLDLASGNYTAGTVSVRLGNGAGAFSGTTSLVSAGINNLVTADLTGDGHLDLAAVNTFDGTNGRPVLIWVGAGDGTFATPATKLTPSVFAYTLSTGDYNGDGIVDLLAARAGSTTGGVDIFSYNATSASFSGPITKSAIGNQPRNVAVADINNDQALDFVTANSVGGNSFSTALGTAGTPLAVAVPAAAATAPAGLQVYPNPASRIVTVELSKGATAAPLLLLNALGQAVLSRPTLAVGQAAQLSLAGLAPGLYVVRCGTLTQRLVVE